MIDISNSAMKEVKKQFNPNGTQPYIRITLVGRGCGGPIFKLIPGNSTDKDEVRQEETLNIVAEKQLLEEFGGIQIHYVESHWGGGHLEIRPFMDLTSGGCGDCRC